jgi:ankyrin repeat protein
MERGRAMNKYYYLIITALIITLFASLPIGADRPYSMKVVFEVIQEGTGKKTEALTYIGHNGVIIQGFHNPSQERVRIQVPVFEKLIIKGSSYTFYFPPIPPDKSYTILELYDVLFQDEFKMKDAELCLEESQLTFIKKTKTDVDWEIPNLGYETPTEKFCKNLFGIRKQRYANWGKPAMDVSEFLGRPIDWKDFRHAALYCARADDIKCSNYPKYSLLAEASKLRDGELVQALIDAGADVNGSEYEYEHSESAALKIAVENNDLNIVHILLAAGASTEVRRSGEETPLMKAAMEGFIDIVKALIQAGADVNAVEHRGDTALIKAFREDHMEIAKLLLEKGANVNVLDSNGTSPLAFAAFRGYKKMVQYLLKAGANVNLGDGTNLLNALKYPDILRILIKAGADVNKTPEGNNRTVLTQAAEIGNPEVVELLIDAGADANISDSWADTALIVAVVYRHPDIVQKLIESGADINKTNKNGNTALHYASEMGQTEILNRLLKAGANIDRADKNGDTSLIKAVRCGRSQIVQRLIDAGANAHAVNKNGQTALYWAKKRGLTNIIKKLDKAGAKNNVP